MNSNISSTKWLEIGRRESNLFYRSQVESTPSNVKYNGTPLH